MNLVTGLAAGSAALVGFSLLTGRKPVIGNDGLMIVAKVGDGQYMRPDAAEAFNRMAEAAAADGITILAGSAFRSIPEQALLYAQYVARLFTAPTVAKPGTSNHGNGTAVDIADAPGRSLTYSSPTYKWLLANASDYDFSWDEGSKVNEPWHWRYAR